MRIGVDTGGTFTDCVVLRGSRIEVVKVFSSTGVRRDSSEDVVAAVANLAGGGDSEPLAIIHGTTVGTNALLERRGARVALVTTAGFEDLIEIGRQNRERLYDLNPRREPPLVPRPLRIGAAERITAAGSVLQRLSTGSLRALCQSVKRSRAESVAICLLFSYTNPIHERTIARALRGLGIPLSVSHEILPEFREYERLSTSVINAYLAPRVGGYLGTLERTARGRLRLRKKGRAERSRPRLYVMQSSGGITTAARAAREPVRTILSGPAGGVVATAWLAQTLGLRKVISFDMGGTSTDVCLLGGAARTTRETICAGLPVAVPVLDIHTVGAGGGSLARLDAGGALRVGPESAGAVPGPICYGRGNTQPTITDAHVVLGRLDPEQFLGGTFQLDKTAAEKCFDDFLKRAPQRAARAAWRSRQALAEGIIAVGNATMEKALRVISVERGHDPREFSLACFGGAGGLHAAELARSLGLRQVIVPQNPGAFSALGVLLSDVVTDMSQSVLLPVPIRAATVRERPPKAARTRQPADFLRALERRFSMLEHQAHAQLRREGLAGHAARVERRLDVRYRGQSYELSVPPTPGFAADFHRAHQQAYGYSDPARDLQIVNLRVRIVIPTPKPPTRRQRLGRSSPPKAALLKKAPVWFANRNLTIPFYDRKRFHPGVLIEGPAVITEYSSTIVVPPGFTCCVDEYTNLVMTHAN